MDGIYGVSRLSKLQNHAKVFLLILCYWKMTQNVNFSTFISNMIYTSCFFQLFNDTHHELTINLQFYMIFIENSCNNIWIIIISIIEFNYYYSSFVIFWITIIKYLIHRIHKQLLDKTRFEKNYYEFCHLKIFVDLGIHINSVLQHPTLSIRNNRWV